MKEINKDILKQLRFRIHNVITSINKEIEESQAVLDNSNSYDVIIDSIKENNLIFAEEKFVESIVNLVNNFNIDDNSRKSILSDIEWLHEMAVMISTGRYDKYNDEEITIINTIINFILKVREAEKNKVDINTSKFNKNNAKLSNYLKLDDKLKKGEFGKEHLDSSEIGMIFELVSNCDNQFKYDVCEMIRLLSIQIHNNIRSNMLENPYESEVDIDDEVNNYDGDEELDLNALFNLFASKSLDFSVFSEKQQKALVRCNFSRIEALLDYICNRKVEFNFLFAGEDNKKINNVGLFYKILRYSTVDILTYLLNNAHIVGVSLDSIFRVPGVFKHASKNSEESINDGSQTNDSDNVSGSFDYYKRNYLIFDNLSKIYQSNGIDIDIFAEILKRTPVILAVSDKTIESNLKCLQSYGIEFVKKNSVGIYVVNSAIYLRSKHMVSNLVNAIENDCFEYVNDNPSCIDDVQKIKELIRRRREGDLRFNNFGKVVDGCKPKVSLDTLATLVNSDARDDYFKDLEVSDIFYDRLKKYSENSSLCRMNDIIQSFDNEVLFGDKKVYKINDLLISRNKVIHVSNAIDGLPEFDKLSLEDRKLFVLTYYSYHTAEEFSQIKEFLTSIRKGGI